MRIGKRDPDESAKCRFLALLTGARARALLLAPLKARFGQLGHAGDGQVPAGRWVYVTRGRRLLAGFL
jgi:hypothetical protein